MHQGTAIVQRHPGRRARPTRGCSTPTSGGDEERRGARAMTSPSAEPHHRSGAADAAAPSPAGSCPALRRASSPATAAGTSSTASSFDVAEGGITCVVGPERSRQVHAARDGQRHPAAAPRRRHVPGGVAAALSPRQTPRARHRARAAEPQPVPRDDGAGERRAGRVPRCATRRSSGAATTRSSSCSRSSPNGPRTRPAASRAASSASSSSPAA